MAFMEGRTAQKRSKPSPPLHAVPKFAPVALDLSKSRNLSSSSGDRSLTLATLHVEMSHHEDRQDPAAANAKNTHRIFVPKAWSTHFRRKGCDCQAKARAARVRESADWLGISQKALNSTHLEETRGRAMKAKPAAASQCWFLEC
jgi:hypothetical protein